MSSISDRNLTGAGPPTQIRLGVVSCMLSAHTRPSPNADSMLGKRRRRWANIETALGECLVFAEAAPTHRIGSITAQVGSCMILASLQRQKAVTAQLKGKQLLLFVFALPLHPEAHRAQ